MAARSRQGTEAGELSYFYVPWEFPEEFDRMSHLSLQVEIEARLVVSRDRDIPGDYPVGKLPT